MAKRSRSRRQSPKLPGRLFGGVIPMLPVELMAFFSMFTGRRRRPGASVWMLAVLAAGAFFSAPELMAKVEDFETDLMAFILPVPISQDAPEDKPKAKGAKPVFTGTATVIDGDTVDIHGQRIRLYGIDAPESRQSCLRGRKAWRCGQQAALALSDRIGRKQISCQQVSMDRYQRVVGRCFLGTEDLNMWMVNQGHAVSYRQYGKDYIPQEEAAKAARRGIWGGEFTMPWDWRKGQRLAGDSGA